MTKKTICKMSPEFRELMEKSKDVRSIVDTMTDDLMKKAAQLPPLPPGWRYDFDIKFEDRGDECKVATVTATPKRIETA